MKKLDASPIAPGVSFKPKGGTLTFLQLANQELFNELMTSRIGPNYSNAYGYILNGCVNSGSGSNYIISAGSVFFNGEIYLVPAASFTISGSNVAVGVITQTQYVADADPSTFTDGNTRNVHNIFQIVFQPGLSGSAAFNFNNAVNLAYKPVGAIGQTIEWYMPGSGSQNSLLATYFDAGTLHGIHPLTLGWIIDDGGIGSIGYLAGDSTFGSIGATGGEKTHTLTLSEVPDPQVVIPAITGGTTPGTTGVGNVYQQNNSQHLASGAGGGAHNNLQPYKVKLKITRLS